MAVQGGRYRVCLRSSLSTFASKQREADITFDLACAWAQAEGFRDGEALRAPICRNARRLWAQSRHLRT
jgi:hypothetical protein